MTDPIKLAIEAAFDEFCDGFDLHSNEWLDKGSGEMFKAGYLAALRAQPEIEAARRVNALYSGAGENPPIFGRRWKLAIDGFGLQRDDLEGNYVHIDDALSVLHESAAQPDHSEAGIPVSEVDPFAVTGISATHRELIAELRKPMHYLSMAKRNRAADALEGKNVQGK